MSAELVPIEVTPDVALRGVTGTVDLQCGELVVRVRSDSYCDATTRAVPPGPPADPTTLSHLDFMRCDGALTPAGIAEHYRITVWCAAHPVLAWLRGWTR